VRGIRDHRGWQQHAAVCRSRSRLLQRQDVNMKELSDLTAGKTALVLDPKDNVAIALTDLAAGDACTVAEDGGKKYEAVVIEKISFGHKFALADLAPNAPVYKYGEEIGKMKVAIKKGAWIHSHNLYCERGM
jgi:altronate dehydratase small subunit